MDDKQFSLPGTSLPMYLDRFSHQLLGTLPCKPFPEACPPPAFLPASWAFSIHSSLNIALFKSAPLLDLRVLGAGLLCWYLCSASGTPPIWNFVFVERMNGDAKDLKAFSATISSKKCILHCNLVIRVCSRTVGNKRSHLFDICFIFHDTQCTLMISFSSRLFNF